MEMTPTDAIDQFEHGVWQCGDYPFSKCVRYLRPDTSVALIRWMNLSDTDAAALHAALYGGKGRDMHGELARLRCVLGQTGGRPGSSPIRVRLASYLVHRASVRFMARNELRDGLDAVKILRMKRQCL